MSLVVLISGRGSNLKAILESSVGSHVACVISDKPNATGLSIAKEHHKPTHCCNHQHYHLSPDFDRALSRLINPYHPTLIALAGFMSILGANFIRRYHHQVVNIHPSLLPDFKGLNTHQRAITAKVKYHGCTVHWVDEVIDSGPIIAQAKVKVKPDDDEKTLAKRVLIEEHQLYPKVLQSLLVQKYYNRF